MLGGETYSSGALSRLSISPLQLYLALSRIVATYVRRAKVCLVVA